uniref:hypothetical protein n=1 Tax=Bartonella sp. CB178 TaxID=3112255 RepID=UPI00300E0695
VSRAKTPREPANKLTIEMRAKHFGLTVEEAKNPLSGTYIGRLYLQGELSQDQYDAAQRYLQIRNDYLCAKGLSGAVYNEMPSSSDDDARDKWVKMATEQFLAVKDVITEAQCLHRQHNLLAALQYVVIEDQSLPYLVPSLRIVLNVLCQHFAEKK